MDKQKLADEIVWVVIMGSLLFPYCPAKGFTGYTMAPMVAQILKEGKVSLTTACANILSYNAVYNIRQRGGLLTHNSTTKLSLLDLFGYSSLSYLDGMLTNTEVSDEVMAKLLIEDRESSVISVEQFTKRCSGYDMVNVSEKVNEYINQLADNPNRKRRIRDNLSQLLRDSKAQREFGETLKLVKWVNSEHGSVLSWQQSHALQNIMKNAINLTPNEWFQLYMEIKTRKGRTIEIREQLARHLESMDVTPELLKTLVTVSKKERAKGFWQTANEALIRNLELDYNWQDTARTLLVKTCDRLAVERVAKFYDNRNIQSFLYYGGAFSAVSAATNKKETKLNWEIKEKKEN